MKWTRQVGEVLNNPFFIAAVVALEIAYAAAEFVRTMKKWLHSR